MYQWNKYANMVKEEEKPWWKRFPIGGTFLEQQARPHGRPIPQEYLQEYYNIPEQRMRHNPIDVRPTQMRIDDFEQEEENLLGEHPIRIPRP